MPHKKSAKKDLIQTKRRTERNRKVKTGAKILVRNTAKSIEAKKYDEAMENAKAMIKALDKAAQKKIMKKNTVARKKSRILKKISALKK
jgi:small subunit ribosomal protein S20